MKLNALHARMRVLLPLLLLSSPALADRQELAFTFQGAPAGSNVYETKPDGTFSSVTKLTLQGMAIESKLTGKRVDGIITEYELAETRPGLSAVARVKDGKLAGEVGGRKIERPFTPGRVVFGNFHPALSASIAEAYPAGAQGSQKVEVLVLDGGARVPVDVLPRQARTVTVAGSRAVVKGAGIRFSSVDMDLHYTEDGRVVAWNVPAQFLKAVAPGYEELVEDPSTRYKELSQPTLKVATQKGVKIPLRDGTQLVADVIRPEEEGKYPVILSRTPYGRASVASGGEWWARRGYIFIAQDVRGRGDSEGEWEPFVHERKDGYDTVDWISKQPWCSGSVGMIGASYGGWVQWWAAVEGHPALKCLVPQVSPPDPFFNMPIDHGIPMLFGGVWWAAVVREKGTLTALPKIESWDPFLTLPISQVDDKVLGNDVPFVDAWWKKQRPSEFGPVNFEGDLKRVKIPALHISGWWDGDGIGTKRNWAAMRKLGRTNQWLIYGPWTHFFNSTSRLGDEDYGPDAVIDLETVYLRWFDTWLKGKSAGLDSLAKARVFVTGANQWRDLDGWPDSRSTARTFYLSGEGPANGKKSVGELTERRPGVQEPDRYTFNPASVELPKEAMSYDTSKADLKHDFGKNDQDQLYYRSAPLEKPLIMTGPVEVDLYFSSSARDTDLYATVVDINEKEEPRLIGRAGKIRAKYHAGFEKPSPLSPGKVYRVTIDHWDVAHQFKAGHRIGLLIRSQGFPVYSRNLGTGEPDATATRMVAQSNAIYHDARRPSALRFRVLGP